MARVLAVVDDPLAHTPALAGAPALMIGTFVEARIRARPIPDAVRLPLAYLRKNDTVWVMRDRALDIREARVVFRDAEYAYITAGLDATNPVVITNLATVVQGAPLRLGQDDQDDR